MKYSYKTITYLLLMISVICYFSTPLCASGINAVTGHTFDIKDNKWTIDGDITNAGTLKTSSGTLSLTGNWTNTGTFNAGTSGTVAFTGSIASTITGANTFANFTCTQSGKQLSFEAGKTQAIGGAWTLTGATGNLIKLRSTVAGTQWKVNPTGTKNITYVDVKDSNNISSTVINPANSTNSGNNTNWFSTSATPTPTPTPSGSDTTAPSNVSISINSGSSHTNLTSVTLTLSATDSVGVTAYYVSTSSSTPTASASGWNSVTSTTSYTGSVSYSLASGDEQKTVYVWFKDAAGNVSSAASDSIILDTTAPIVTITSPTSNDTYTATSSALTLEGSASDTTSGVKEVTWSNDKGGSGDASGTTYWSVSSISLTSGENKITVTAKDNAGNTSTDTITVTYNAGKVPTVTTGSATNVTETLATLNGTVNANGLTTTAWFNYGTNSGSYTNTTSTQTISGSSDTAISINISGLSAGTKYYYKLAAQNSAGTSTGSEASFTTKTLTTTCEATSISVSPDSLALAANESSLVTVTVTGEDNCAVEGETVTATLDATGENYIVVSPASQATDANGQAIFTITALNNSGNAAVVFKAGSLTKTLKVSVITQESIVFGFVIDEDDNPLKGVTVTITGNNSSDSTETDENGYYEFNGLSQGDYTLTYEKEGYLSQTQDISLEEGELKDLGTVTMEQVVKGKISGYVVNIKGDPIESVRLKLKGIRTKVIKSASSDADGFFEFTDLDADTYVIVAKKKKYRNTRQKVVLEEGESTEIEIVMKKTSKRIKELLLEEDVQ